MPAYVCRCARARTHFTRNVKQPELLTTTGIRVVIFIVIAVFPRRRIIIAEIIIRTTSDNDEPHRRTIVVADYNSDHDYFKLLCYLYSSYNALRIDIARRDTYYRALFRKLILIEISALSVHVCLPLLISNYCYFSLLFPCAFYFFMLASRVRVGNPKCRGARGIDLSRGRVTPG